MPLGKQIGPQNVKYWIIGGACLAVLLDIPQGILQPLDHVQLAQNITGHINGIVSVQNTRSVNARFHIIVL
jgi:hypothetical protein